MLLGWKAQSTLTPFVGGIVIPPYFDALSPERPFDLVHQAFFFGEFFLGVEFV